MPIHEGEPRRSAARPFLVALAILAARKAAE
jgi:hypothetical protein